MSTLVSWIAYSEEVSFHVVRIFKKPQEGAQMKRNQLTRNLSEPPGKCILEPQPNLQMTATPISI